MIEANNSLRPPGKPLLDTAIMSAALSLPVLQPGLFGLLTGLIPLPVFFFLVRHGEKKGRVLVRNSILITVGLGAVTGALPQVVFVLSLVPLGFGLARAAARKLDPIRAGLSGILVLGLTWLLFWAVTGLIHQANPYVEFREILDQSLAEMAALYQKTEKLPVDVRLEINATVQHLRTLVPRILPAFIGCIVLYTVWLNLVLGNRLVKRFHPELTPWPPFCRWKLPDNLVWPGIAGGLMLLVSSGAVADLGLNILLVSIGLYALQGLAIVGSFLQRWSVVRPLRVAIYGLILLQHYGIILVAMLGVADIWFDFRNRPAAAGKTGTNSPME
ncbi:MAG: YybS family protein [Desulfobacterales bacterium]|nr:YybS family protein [Desulfobacterales bacterium]